MTNPATGSMEFSTCLFTIASKNYLSQVRTLLSSVKEHHPDVHTCLLLCDRVDGCFEPSAESFQIDLGGRVGDRLLAGIRLQIYLPGTEYGHQTVRDRQIVPAMMVMNG